jgi:hypothetical protein
MTIEKGKRILDKSDATSNEIIITIAGLEHEKQYVENCIALNFREQSSGETVVKEISDLITKLKEKLQHCTN